MTTLESEIYYAVLSAGYTPSRHGQTERARKLAAVRAEHPDATICVVRDEYTGRRFERAKRNRGRCRKLGHNSTNRGGIGRNCYQVWARWDD